MKLLVLDIETAPHRVYSWGLYDQDIGINQIVEPGYTLCFAAKWLDSREVMFHSSKRHDQMVRAAHKLLSEADAVIHYNGTKFDIPTLNKEFVLAGLKPPEPYRQIDLLSTCRQQFRFASNKLDYISQVLGEGAKVEHKGMELWKGCMGGEAASWRVMESYNKHDVRLTERLYHRLLPWIRSHPNRSLYDGDTMKACPGCGSHKLQARGFAYTTSYTYKRWQCQGCGKWSRSSTKEPQARPKITNLAA